MKIINLTPHTINIVNEENKITRTIESSGIVRLSQETKVSGKIDGVTISESIFGQSEGLPGSELGIFYVVSRLVLAAHPERDDLLVPNELVRDEKGRILGCRSLAIN